MKAHLMALGVVWFLWQRHPVSEEWSRMWSSYETHAACEAMKRDFAPLRPRVRLQCLPDGKQPKGKVERPLR